ncbi:MAG TPA: HlyD family efflux transporter periplasmic adaptor subunit, partial [Gemmataceae bacterium]
LLVCAAGAAAALGGLAGCAPAENGRVQGYVEGEFVYVASPQPGELEYLYVRRGARVEAGEPLFALEEEPERAARDEARRRLAQARANLEDAKKGKRPSEIEAIEAQLRQAQAALALSESELARLQRLHPTGAATVEELDRARSGRNQDAARVLQLEAELKTARLGARQDQIEAAEAEVRAREAALARAEWNLAQKRQAAPQAGLVFDTLYREGEWVSAGRPVVALLPPANVKVRAFVPEARVATVQVGDPVRVTADGLPEPFTGTVSFISPRAEFTPPVIYSRESRGKLVFMTEIVFDPETAARLHPGQPVDVEFGP